MGTRLWTVEAARQGPDTSTEHARTPPECVQVGRDTVVGRSSIVGSLYECPAALPISVKKLNAENVINSSDYRPIIDRMLGDDPAGYGRLVYELCDIKNRHWKIGDLGAGFTALRLPADS